MSVIIVANTAEPYEVPGTGLKYALHTFHLSPHSLTPDEVGSTTSILKIRKLA